MKAQDCKIKYLNSKKNFAETEKVFKGKNAYDKAVQWGEKNLENFDTDMIKYI